MKKWRLILTAILLIVATISISGCGQSGNTNEDAPQQGDTSEEKTDDEKQIDEKEKNRQDSEAGNGQGEDQRQPDRPKTTTIHYENEGMDQSQDATLYVSPVQPISFYVLNDYVVKQSGDQKDTIVFTKNERFVIQLEVLKSPDWTALEKEANASLSEKGKVHETEIEADPELKGTKVFVVSEGEKTHLIMLVPAKNNGPDLKVSIEQPVEMEYGGALNEMIKSVELLP